MNIKCECDGYKYFWGAEIKNWKGRSSDRVRCIKCGSPTFLERVLYWWYGYTSNEQIKRHSING